VLTDDGPPADDFKARGADELSFTKGDRIVLIERDGEYQDGWYYGKHQTMGTIGLFPEGGFKWSSAWTRPGCLIFANHAKNHVIASCSIHYPLFVNQSSACYRHSYNN
jgi:hypothetical protein